LGSNSRRQKKKTQKKGKKKKKTKTKQKTCAASPEESCRVCLSTIETDDGQPEAARSQKKDTTLKDYSEMRSKPEQACRGPGTPAV